MNMHVHIRVAYFPLSFSPSSLSLLVSLPLPHFVSLILSLSLLTLLDFTPRPARSVQRLCKKYLTKYQRLYGCGKGDSVCERSIQLWKRTHFWNHLFLHSLPSIHPCLVFPSQPIVAKDSTCTSAILLHPFSPNRVVLWA